MSIAGVLTKWRRLRKLAADQQTLKYVRALFFERYRYPGRALFRNWYPLPRPDAITLVLRGNEDLVYIKLRPHDEGDIASFFENFIESDPKDITSKGARHIMDAGAHIGCFTVAMHARQALHGVIALEPDPANSELLKENFRLNSIKGQIIEAALWKESTTLQFRAGTSNAGHITETQGGKTFPVKALSFWEAVQDASQEIDFLKLDIEGAEMAVLPAIMTADNSPSSILVEIHEAAVNRPVLEKLWLERGWTAKLQARFPPHEVWLLQKA